MGHRKAAELFSCSEHARSTRAQATFRTRSPPQGHAEFAGWINRTQQESKKARSIAGSLVAHVISRGKAGVREQETWADGTRIAAN